MIDELFSGPAAFEHRGYMLDVSRDRVPTRETLAWLLELLGALRFTELQLYVEHTFTYAGHDDVWRDASPLTHADMAWIRDVAADCGIELVANMNGFGHMARWLVHDRYRDRAECPDGAPGLMGDELMAPTCLEPTAANADFAVDLARQMLAAVGSRRIHIGGDEPFELGECRSAGRAAEMGRDRLYLDHLRAIIDPLSDDGIEVLFWADLFRRDRALMSDLPPDATGVVWNYEAPSESSWHDLIPEPLFERLGLPDDANLGFAAHARLFIEADISFWVAPGTGSWNTIIGRNENAAANIADAAEVGSAHGAKGFLLADWGDNGHWQPLVVSLPSMIRAAVAAWHGRSVDVDVGATVDHLLEAEPGTGLLLDELGHLGESLGVGAPNASPVFLALADTGLPVSGALDAAAHRTAVARVDAAAAVFAGRPFGGERGDILAVELEAACGLAALGLARIGGDEPSESDFDRAVAAQREAWLASSRSGGLDDSLDHLRR